MAEKKTKKTGKVPDDSVSDVSEGLANRGSQSLADDFPFEDISAEDILNPEEQNQGEQSLDEIVSESSEERSLNKRKKQKKIIPEPGYKSYIDHDYGQRFGLSPTVGFEMKPIRYERINKKTREITTFERKPMNFDELVGIALSQIQGRHPDYGRGFSLFRELDKTLPAESELTGIVRQHFSGIIPKRIKDLEQLHGLRNDAAYFLATICYAKPDKKQLEAMVAARKEKPNRKIREQLQHILFYYGYHKGNMDNIPKLNEIFNLNVQGRPNSLRNHLALLRANQELYGPVGFANFAAVADLVIDYNPKTGQELSDFGEVLLQTNNHFKKQFGLFSRKYKVVHYLYERWEHLTDEERIEYEQKIAGAWKSDTQRPEINEVVHSLAGAVDKYFERPLILPLMQMQHGYFDSDSNYERGIILSLTRKSLEQFSQDAALFQGVETELQRQCLALVLRLVGSRADSGLVHEIAKDARENPELIQSYVERLDLIDNLSLASGEEDSSLRELSGAFWGREIVKTIRKEYQALDREDFQELQEARRTVEEMIDSRSCRGYILRESYLGRLPKSRPATVKRICGVIASTESNLKYVGKEYAKKLARVFCQQLEAVSRYGEEVFSLEETVRGTSPKVPLQMLSPRGQVINISRNPGSVNIAAYLAKRESLYHHLAALNEKYKVLVIGGEDNEREDNERTDNERKDSEGEDNEKKGDRQKDYDKKDYSRKNNDREDNEMKSNEMKNSERKDSGRKEGYLHSLLKKLGNVNPSDFDRFLGLYFDKGRKLLDYLEASARQDRQDRQDGQNRRDGQDEQNGQDGQNRQNGQNRQDQEKDFKKWVDSLLNAPSLLKELTLSSLSDIIVAEGRACRLEDESAVLGKFASLYAHSSHYVSRTEASNEIGLPYPKKGRIILPESAAFFPTREKNRAYLEFLATMQAALARFGLQRENGDVKNQPAGNQPVKDRYATLPNPAYARRIENILNYSEALVKIKNTHPRLGEEMQAVIEDVKQWQANNQIDNKTDNQADSQASDNSAPSTSLFGKPDLESVLDVMEKYLIFDTSLGHSSLPLVREKVAPLRDADSTIEEKVRLIYRIIDERYNIPHLVSPPAGNGRSPAKEEVVREVLEGAYANQEIFFYPEAGSERPARVIPILARGFPNNEVQQIKSKHKQQIAATQDLLERIKPARVVTERRLYDGELDEEAYINMLLEMKAGQNPDTNIFTQRRIRERDVDVLLSIDQSSLTGKWLSETHRLIDHLRLMIVYFNEATAQLQDNLAVMGYSSQGINEVYVNIFKNFEEEQSDKLDYRLGLVAPLHQSRTGAAYRHFAHLFRQRDAQRKIHFDVITQLAKDVDYTGEKAAIDLLLAARAEKASGVELFAFCLDSSVPREFLKEVYGSGHFLMIQHPERLGEALIDTYKVLTL